MRVKGWGIGGSPYGTRSRFVGTAGTGRRSSPSGTGSGVRSRPRSKAVTADRRASIAFIPICPDVADSPSGPLAPSLTSRNPLPFAHLSEGSPFSVEPRGCRRVLWLQSNKDSMMVRSAVRGALREGKRAARASDRLQRTEKVAA